MLNLNRIAAFCAGGLVSAVVLSAVAFQMSRIAQKPGWLPDHSAYILPNGWNITPAGAGIDLPGDMPGTFIQLKNSNRAVINTCGYHDHSISLIDLTTKQILSTVSLKQNWVGVTQVSDNEIWVSGGFADASKKLPAVLKFKIVGDTLASDGEVSIFGGSPKGVFVSAMLSSDDSVYLLNCQNDEALKVSKSGEILKRMRVGYRPYGLALTADKAHLAVSNWGAKSVSILNSDSLELEKEISVDAQPTAIVFTKDDRLFVANSGSNHVSIIHDWAVEESVKTGISTQQNIGSTPLSLALSADENILFVANAGNNCITVLDISKPGQTQFSGLIPTERYPAIVAVTKDNNQLVIASAKGNYGPNGVTAEQLAAAKASGKDIEEVQKYIGNQLQGRLRIMPIPSTEGLREMTAQVKANRPIWEASASEAAEKQSIERDVLSKIKHVVYVIRENRTYDQVLGDVKKGDGSASMAIFGEPITPNSHKIADEFVLFDNLYTDGETSQAGHQWTDSAYATDYCEKMWILGYSRRGTLVSDPRLTSTPGEYLWSLARKHGLKARVYGEYVDRQEDHNSVSDPEVKADPEKFGYSATFEKIFARGGRDPEKVEDFLKEMHTAETEGGWPNVMVMALPEDHTHGFSAGSYSPRAMIASNDQALGKLVEGISHSKFWADTAIFVIQDDAQAGPDHVDSHRTVGFVISAYTHRGIVDHRHYTTSSMLRTMEITQGLPPMSQYDELANTMHFAFTKTPNLMPYSCVPPPPFINEKNPGGTTLARRSAKLDFSEIDKADFNELNHILWEGYRPGIPYPK